MKKSKWNVHEDDVQPAKVKREDGWRQLNFRILLSKETVGSTAGMLYKTITKYGAAHEKHIHHNADELDYVIKGKGRHGQNDEHGKPVEWDVGPGDAYFIPRGTIHWAYGTDPNDPMTLVGVYVGAGCLEETGYEFIGPLDQGKP